VSAARRGELPAFNELVERHQAVVFNVCLRMLRDPQAAEDAAQDTFFVAYRSISSFRGGVFRGWLLRIAANQCYDELRRRRRRPADSLPEEPLIADPSPPPEQATLSAESASAIEKALSQLPPEQRLCALLVDVQGLDYEEAAQAMSVNLGTLKSRLSRARAQLRELLRPEFRLGDGG